MAASAALRWVRSGVFAAVCTVLAVTAHALSMSVVPALWAQAGGFAAVWVLAWAGSSRERSLAPIAAAMGLVQGCLHLFFEVSARPAGGMSMHPGSAAMADMPGMRMAAAGGGAAMMTGHALAAHGLAALAAAWWLRRGEAAVFSLLRHAAFFAFRLYLWPGPSVLPVLPRRVPTADRADRFLPASSLLRYVVVRRGPPPAGPVPARA